MSEQDSTPPAGSCDAVVVGAGIAGLYAVHRLRERGLTVRAFEAGSGPGGVWYWNRYPGARCDVESVDYSYSFSDELQQDWDWSEKYATQPEILRYLEHVADRFDLRRSFQFDTRVTSATLDEQALRWTVRTDRGEQVSARFLLTAVGPLSNANTPAFDGLDTFGGEVHHTATWPHEGVDFTGKRVGVIGTGSSGIQSIPLIAEQAERLFVFQRTANYSIPAGNTRLDDATRAAHKADYPERRRLSWESGGGSPHRTHPKKTLDVTARERDTAYEERWKLGGVLFSKTFPDQLTDLAANDTAREFWERKVRAVIDDPAIAELLVPNDHAMGAKRIVTDSGYYETYNRGNVELVNLKADPIVGMDATGVNTTGAHYELDAIVLATGFDAMTGSLDKLEIVGRGGQTLKDKWTAGPETYLGLGVDGFPNFFNVNGPGATGVLANMVLHSELHVDWIADAIAYLDDHGGDGIEAEPEAVAEWVDKCRTLAEKSLLNTANSWYLGANIPGRPRVFMPFAGGFSTYREIITGIAESGYKGFAIR
ncbi:flavin-containing monooxygenase [Speluncibacter jeojiensis]|uniref:flavin-containing monooxygenase n=1 Tax=Speluncibacter jeojiensis TaxID=2710754 RepID=UPI00241099B0|nr:NAD(P)/FAD-dependent oxidoreductase [Rhodococcus sp. D2-41]